MNIGITIAMNEKAAPILGHLGSSIILGRVAFEGLDKIYTYSGFELHTYEIEGVDYGGCDVFRRQRFYKGRGVSVFRFR